MVSGRKLSLTRAPVFRWGMPMVLFCVAGYVGLSKASGHSSDAHFALLGRLNVRGVERDISELVSMFVNPFAVCLGQSRGC